MCYTQNGSGYETFFRIDMVPKKVWTPLWSSSVGDSIASACCGRRRTSSIEARGRTCSILVCFGNRQVWGATRMTTCGARWVYGHCNTWRFHQKFCNFASSPALPRTVSEFASFMLLPLHSYHSCLSHQTATLSIANFDSFTNSSQRECHDRVS